MKKPLFFWASLVAMPLLAEVIEVVSPDGKNRLELDTGAAFTVQVRRNGETLCRPSPVSLTVAGRGTLGAKAAKPSSVRRTRRTGVFKTPFYKRAQVDESANVAVVRFDGWALELLARNDGVAYRWVTEFDGKIEVKDERFDLSESADSSVYAAYANSSFNGDPFQNSWEQPAYACRLADISSSVSNLLQAPVVFPFKGAAMAVTESDLRDYPGLEFRRDASDPSVLGAVFAREPDRKLGGDFDLPFAKEGERKRYVRVVTRKDRLVETVGARGFPWRTFLLADTPAQLVDSDIVYALAKPNAIGDTSWIRPGKVAWDWWNAMNLSGCGSRLGGTAAYEHFIDFAAKHGIEYVIFDEGWSKSLDIFSYADGYDVEKLIERANAKNVGIILWMAWGQIDGRMEEVAAYFSKRGVKGFKVDFMDRDDADIVRGYEELAAVCARHKLVLDLHGAYKPTGLQRTYPNLLNFEGVHGLEQSKWPQAHDLVTDEVTIPFVRMLAGPLDFTPGAMRNFPRYGYQPYFFRPGAVGSRVRQMALMSIYEAPLQMLCDSPTVYARNLECLKFMVQVPTVWDEQLVLGGVFGDWFAIARRKRDTWYVSAINEWKLAGRGVPQEIPVKLSFLGEGEWTADVFEDGPNADRDPEEYVRKTMTFRSSDTLTMKLMEGGGFTARFNRAPPKPRPALAERLESEIEVIGIVHWGLNTYTDREWGFGDEDPKLLNPAHFNADQIVGACADGGIGGLVVVAKHHDGFCLWPTKTTGHNISKSPFRGGKGDYVKEMSDACRKAGVKFGVYCSPWDRNSADYASKKYVETFHAQVRELLDGRYGEVFEMWFDGANGGDGYYGGARERRKICGVEYYDFDTVFDFVRKMQPKVCIFTELRDDADFRWPCNELGVLDPNSRATIRPFDDEYMSYGNVGDVDGSVFHPCEADFPLRPGWFCHEAQNADVKSGEYLMRLYLSNVGNGGTMNIGISPSKDGTLHSGDVLSLKRFGELRRRFFANEVTDGGDFNLVVMSEDIRQGERVADWTLWSKGQALVEGKSVGRRRIRTFQRPLPSRSCWLDAKDMFGRPVPTTVRFFRVEPKLLDSVLNAVDTAAAVDQHGLGAVFSQDERSITYKFEASSRFDRLRFVPDLDHLGGTPVEFRLAVSADGKKWKQAKGTYRLDNVAANPVPQLLKLDESVEAVYLRVSAVRTLKDQPVALAGVAIAR